MVHTLPAGTRVQRAGGDTAADGAMALQWRVGCQNPTLLIILLGNGEKGVNRT
jgi:hypothetical protein